MLSARWSRLGAWQRGRAGHLTPWISCFVTRCIGDGEGDDNGGGSSLALSSCVKCPRLSVVSTASCLFRLHVLRDPVFRQHCKSIFIFVQGGFFLHVSPTFNWLGS